MRALLGLGLFAWAAYGLGPCELDLVMLSGRLDFLAWRYDPALQGQQLTALERAALAAYTGNWSGAINSPLRKLWWEPRSVEDYLSQPGVVPHFEKLPIARELVRALAKLPHSPGTHYRDANLRPERIETYRVGTVVTETSFLSTSKERSKAVGLGVVGTPVLFVIQGGRGKDVGALSAKGGLEAEVLYQPFTRFRVRGRRLETHRNTETLVIEMEEIVD